MWPTSITDECLCVSPSTLLHYTILYYTILYCSAVHCNILYYTTLIPTHLSNASHRAMSDPVDRKTAHHIAECHMDLCHPIMSQLIVSLPISRCPIPSYITSSYPFPSHYIPSYPFPSNHIPSHPIISLPISLHPIPSIPSQECQGICERCEWPCYPIRLHVLQAHAGGGGECRPDHQWCRQPGTAPVCVCLLVYVFVCLPVYMCLCLSAWLSICLSVCLSISDFLSVCMSVCLSLCDPSHIASLRMKKQSLFHPSCYLLTNHNARVHTSSHALSHLHLTS